MTTYSLNTSRTINAPNGTANMTVSWNYGSTFTAIWSNGSKTRTFGKTTAGTQKFPNPTRISWSAGLSNTGLSIDVTFLSTAIVPKTIFSGGILAEAATLTSDLPTIQATAKTGFPYGVAKLFKSPVWAFLGIRYALPIGITSVRNEVQSRTRSGFYTTTRTGVQIWELSIPLEPFHVGSEAYGRFIEHIADVGISKTFEMPMPQLSKAATEFSASITTLYSDDRNSFGVKSDAPATIPAGIFFTAGHSKVYQSPFDQVIRGSGKTDYIQTTPTHVDDVTADVSLDFSPKIRVRYIAPPIIDINTSGHVRTTMRLREAP